MTVTRLHQLALAVACVIGASLPGFAQTRLYLLTSGHWCGVGHCIVPRVIDVDVDNRRITASTPVRRVFWPEVGPGVTPDGRALLWSGIGGVDWNDFTYPAVVFFDTAGRSEWVPFAGDGSSEIAPFFVHPAEMRAFMQLSLGGRVTIAEPGGTRLLPPPPCPVPSLEAQSGDGRRLSLLCQDPPATMVVDGTDGRLIGSVPVAPTAHVLDRAGTTMFGVEWDVDTGVAPTIYRRFDVATGATLAERVVPAHDVGVWAYNRATGHVYVGVRQHIAVLDAATLATVHTIEGSAVSRRVLMALDPERPHAYIAWQEAGEGGLRVRLAVVHTTTFATLDWAVVPVDSFIQGMALGPRPPRTSALSATVANATATLNWQVSGTTIATGPVLEVGFAPGETVIRVPLAAAATNLTVPGVPPGRYFVRVRAVNGTGIGAPSNEVMVEAPQAVTGRVRIPAAQALTQTGGQRWPLPGSVASFWRSDS